MLRPNSSTSSGSTPSLLWTWKGNNPSVCHPAPTVWCTGGWRYCRAGFEPQGLPGTLRAISPSPSSSGLRGSHFSLQLHRNRRQPGRRSSLNGEDQGQGPVSHAPDPKQTNKPRPSARCHGRPTEGSSWSSGYVLGSSSWFILQPCPFVGDWGRTQAQGHSFLLC